MFFKICLRMKYVLQVHNQSRKVLHLEILLNRTILQNLPTNNNVCHKPDHEDLWGCKASHSMFLEFLPSIFWWHLIPNRGVRSCTTPLLLAWKLCAVQQGNTLYQEAFSSLPVQNLKEKIKLTSPSTLLGTYCFHTHWYRTVHSGSNTIPKNQWAASYGISCVIRSAIHNLFLPELTNPWNLTVCLELLEQKTQESLEHTLKNRGNQCTQVHPDS